MKKLIRDDITLSDVLRKIIKFEIVDDARDVCCVMNQMPISLFASEDIDTDPDHDQQETDQWYLGYTDAELVKVAPDIIHKFQNLDLLIRIGKLNKDLLSQPQKDYLNQILSQKDTKHTAATDADINYLLQLIKECDRIDYDLVHTKTNAFTFNHRGEFRENAVMHVLKGLTIEDWRSRTRSINYRYLGNTLFIFAPDITWNTTDGKTEYLKIYIKLDVDKSTKYGIALVSFHPYGEAE